MDAPEKVYLHPDIGGREFIRPWLRKRANQESVEYVRTDAFIKKAAEWLNETLRNTDFYENEIELMVKEFKKAMKGEKV